MEFIDWGVVCNGKTTLEGWSDCNNQTILPDFLGPYHPIPIQPYITYTPVILRFAWRCPDCKVMWAPHVDKCTCMGATL